MILVNRFQRAIDSLFQHMGMDGEYQRIGRNKKTVRLIFRQLDPMVELNDRPLIVDSFRVDVRVSELTEPQRGDLFFIDGKTYQVEDEPQLSQHRLVWLMTVLPVSSPQPPPTQIPTTEIPAISPPANIDLPAPRLQVR